MSPNQTNGDVEMRLALNCTYYAATTTCFDMPEGKVWDDVRDWYVKWGTLYLTFKDGTELQIETQYIEIESIDQKRPVNSVVMPCHVEGEYDDEEIDWDTEIATQ